MAAILVYNADADIAAILVHLQVCAGEALALNGPGVDRCFAAKVTVNSKNLRTHHMNGLTVKGNFPESRTCGGIHPSLLHRRKDSIIGKLVSKNHSGSTERIAFEILQRDIVVVIVTGVDIQALAAAQELIIQGAVVLHVINDIAAVIDNFHTEKSLIGTDPLLGFHGPDRVIVGDNIAVVPGSLDKFIDILGGVFSGTIGAGFRHSGKLFRGANICCTGDHSRSGWYFEDLWQTGSYEFPTDKRRTARWDWGGYEPHSR